MLLLHDWYCWCNTNVAATGVRHWQEARSCMLKLFEGFVRIPSINGDGAFCNRGVPAAATTMLAAFLQLVCGSLKQIDWHHDRSMPIGYASTALLHRRLLTRIKGGEGLPNVVLRRVMEAAAMADMCVHGNLLASQQLFSKDVDPRTTDLDIAAAAIHACVQAWSLGTAEWWGAAGGELKFSKLLQDVELHMTHWMRHLHIGPLLHMMGFRGVGSGRVVVDPIASYTAEEAVAAKCMVSLVQAASCRANQTCTLAACWRDPPRNGDAGGPQSAVHSSSVMSGMGASKSKVNQSKQDRRSMVATAFLQMRTGFVAAMFPLCSEKASELMETPCSDRVEAISDWLSVAAAATDTEPMFKEALELAELMPMHKDHIKSHRDHADKATCFIPVVGQSTDGAPSDVHTAIAEQFSEDKPMVVGEQLGGRAGADAGYLYAGVVCIDRSAQAVLPGLQVNDDKEWKSLKDSTNCHPLSARYRAQFASELRVSLGIGDGNVGSLDQDLSELDSALHTCGLRQVCDFVSTMCIAVEGCGELVPAQIGMDGLVEAIVRQCGQVQQMHGDEEDEFTSAHCIDESRKALSSASKAYAVPEVAGIMRIDLDSEEFRIIVFHEWAGEDGCTHTVVRTGPWSEAERISKSKPSIKIASSHLVCAGTPIDAVCGQAMRHLLACGWLTEARIEEKHVKTVLAGEGFGAHTHVWVESRTPGPANMQVRTYHRQAVGDLQDGKAGGGAAGALFGTTLEAPPSLFGVGSKTAAAAATAKFPCAQCKKLFATDKGRCAHMKSCNSRPHETAKAGAFSNLNVYKLRKACTARGLVGDGLKVQIVKRLEEHDAEFPPLHGQPQPGRNGRSQQRRNTLKAIAVEASKQNKRGKKSDHTVRASSHKTRSGGAANSASGTAAHKPSVATGGFTRASRSLVEAAAAPASKSLVEGAAAPTCGVSGKTAPPMSLFGAASKAAAATPRAAAAAAAMPRPAPSAALTKLEQLQEDKAAAVRAEDYIAAKSLKAEIDALKEHLAATTDAPGRDIGSRVAALEREKAIAVAREDYDAAKQIKGEIESLVAQMDNCKSSTMANAPEKISPNTATQIQQVKAAITAMAVNTRPGQQELQRLQAQLQEMQQPQHQQPRQPHQPRLS